MLAEVKRRAKHSRTRFHDRYVATCGHSHVAKQRCLMHGPVAERHMITGKHVNCFRPTCTIQQMTMLPVSLLSRLTDNTEDTWRTCGAARCELPVRWSPVAARSLLDDADEKEERLRSKWDDVGSDGDDDPPLPITFFAIFFAFCIVKMFVLFNSGVSRDAFRCAPGEKIQCRLAEQ